MVHAKTATIDGSWSTVGTANIDRLSLQGNYEINIEVIDPDFAAVMERVFATDECNCLELTLARVGGARPQPEVHRELPRAPAPPALSAASGTRRRRSLRPMPSAPAALAPLVSAAIEEAFGAEHRDADPVLRPSQYADFQSNAALPLAKRLGMPPRDVAQRIVEHLGRRCPTACATPSRSAARASST